MHKSLPALAVFDRSASIATKYVVSVFIIIPFVGFVLTSFFLQSSKKRDVVFFKVKPHFIQQYLKI